jgi:hypothetical protein
MRKEVEDTKLGIVGRTNWLNTLTDKILLNDYYSFTFVRNPYDRLLSAYLYRRISSEFKYFVENELVNENGEFWDDHFYPQSWCAECDGEIFTEFIGKFENIAKDWNSVANKIGVSPHLPRTPNGTAPESGIVYYDDKTRDLVRKIYKRDFELFDYE